MTSRPRPSSRRDPSRPGSGSSSRSGSSSGRPPSRSSSPSRSGSGRSSSSSRSGGSGSSRSGSGRSPSSRSGSGRTASGRSPSSSRSGRSASGRASGSSRSSSRSGRGTGATARRRDEEAPAAFRSSRRDDDRGRSGGRTRASKRTRRPRQPITDGGQRNASYLTATVVGLTLFGLVMVLSASSPSSLHELHDSSLTLFNRQAMWAGIGAVAFLVTSRLDYRVLRLLAKPLLLSTIAMLLVVLVPGVGRNINGSSRWLGLGPVVIQPGEIAKLVVIVFVADLLAGRERRMDRPELTVRPVMVVLGILSALLLAQPKLGTPIIMGAVCMLMLFIAGARVRHLFPWMAAAVALAASAAVLVTYRLDRLTAFLDPWDDPFGIGRQLIQSQVSIASGGLFGVGLGGSRAKWGFLPYPYTDFIFAIVAEEVGIIGASALICGFLMIGWFGLRAAMYAPDKFGTLLAAGITCWLMVQAFLNIGMVVGVLPITGEPLPFVSAGGSSLVSTLGAAGLLASVSRRARV